MATPTKFRMIRDINGYNGFGVPFSNLKYSAKLAASTAQQMTIPDYVDKYLVIFAFEPGDPVWVAKNTTAAIPAGTLSTTDSELNPVAREVFKGETLSFITSGSDVEIGIVLYAVE